MDSKLKYANKYHEGKAVRLAVYLGVASILIGLMSLGGVGAVNAQTVLTSQMQLGSRGAQVSALQSFLATMPTIYPQGLVTGYFGTLTRAAVIRFQAAHGIDQVGRVGPITLAKINSLLAGGGTPTGDASAPVISNPRLVNNSNSSVTFTWATNEQASGRVIYSTTPVTFVETENSLVPVTGQQVGGNLGSSQSITLTGLSPNTTYYYTLIATDAAGNVQAFGPNLTFRTNQ